MNIGRLLLAILLGLVIVKSAYADEWAQIEKSKTLNCGVYSNVPPFSSPDPVTRQLEGMDVDLCNAIANNLHLKAVHTPLSVEARVASLISGRVNVVVANLSFTRTRGRQIQFSDPYYLGREQLLVKEEFANKPLSFFKGKRLSSTEGSTSQQGIELNGSRAITFQDTSSAFLSMMQNKTLGVVANTMTDNLLKNRANAVGIKLAIIPQPVAIEPNGVGMKNGEPRLLQHVNQALYALDQEGVIDRIWNKWLGPTTQYHMARQDRVQKLSAVAGEALP